MTNTVLQLLIAERDKLNRAIEALQPEPEQTGRRSPATKRARRGMSAAARKAQSKRMKAYWAQKRKQKAQKAKSAA